MGANSFTISVDSAALTEALLTLPQALKPFIKAAARISADHIRDEAKARLKRQLVAGVGKGFGGHPTGETVEGIKVKSDRSGYGWIVDSGNARMPMLPRWLEKGTVNMPARPFFWESARLEEDAHASRIHAAVLAGLSEHGLGGEQ